MSLSSCGRQRDAAKTVNDAPVGGTIVIAAAADADALVPPLILSLQGKQIVDQIFDNLADIGPRLNTVGDAGFTPRLASSWQWSADSLEVDFKLDPRARWHDGVPVHSEDVRFTFGLLKDPALGSPLSGNLDNVDSVSLPTGVTAPMPVSATRRFTVPSPGSADPACVPSPRGPRACRRRSGRT